MRASRPQSTMKSLTGLLPSIEGNAVNASPRACRGRIAAHVPCCPRVPRGRNDRRECTRRVSIVIAQRESSGRRGRPGVAREWIPVFSRSTGIVSGEPAFGNSRVTKASTAVSLGERLLRRIDIEAPRRARNHRRWWVAGYPRRAACVGSNEDQAELRAGLTVLAFSVTLAWVVI